MKNLTITFLLILVLKKSSQNQQQQSIFCDDNNLVLKIPVKDKFSSNLLYLKSGDCDELNFDGEVIFDEVNLFLEIKIPIKTCNLDGGEKYGSPKNPNFLLKNRELLEIFSNELLPLSFFEGKITDKNISIKQMASFKKGVFEKTPCY